MLDRSATALIKPAINRLARVFVEMGLSANQMTLIGFFIGLVAVFLIANDAYLAGAIAILLSRLCDGLDGAMARQTQATDLGGYLDIVLDFLFYAAVPLAFAVAQPQTNALPAAVLLAAFVGTGSSFLAFAIIAAKRGLSSADYPNKTFYFMGGLTEATETLLCFLAMCLWPAYFAVLAYVFAALCLITIVMRIGWGWQKFS
jgi:phosphatidylglycerophosphate synthase